MQNDKIYSEIVSSLARTRFEANMLLTEVEALERSLFKIGKGDFDSTLKSSIRATTAYAIATVIGSGDREEALKRLKAEINALTFLGLTIAFEPNLEIINRIYVWVKQNLGPGIALDISVDKTILGGAVIEYKGKIASFTLLTKVEQYFLSDNVNL